MSGKTIGEIIGIILSERGFLLRTAAPYTRQKLANLTQYYKCKLLIDRNLTFSGGILTIPSSPQKQPKLFDFQLFGLVFTNLLRQNCAKVKHSPFNRKKMKG